MKAWCEKLQSSRLKVNAKGAKHIHISLQASMHMWKTLKVEHRKFAWIMNQRFVIMKIPAGSWLKWANSMGVLQ